MRWNPFISFEKDGKAHIDLAGHRGDRGIGAFDLAVRPNGFHPIEIVGVTELGPDDIADIRAVARQ